MADDAVRVPEGASAVIPRLFCRDPAAEADFCATVFGAEERVRRPGPDGAVAHVLMMIGPAMVMIESEWPGITNRAPSMDGSSPVALYVYLDDVDSAVRRALDRGATVLSPPQDQFWGDRTAWVMDPQGHVWTFAARVEETTDAQRSDRLAAIRAAERGT